MVTIVPYYTASFNNLYFKFHFREFPILWNLSFIRSGTPLGAFRHGGAFCFWAVKQQFVDIFEHSVAHNARNNNAAPSICCCRQSD